MRQPSETSFIFSNKSNFRTRLIFEQVLFSLEMFIFATCALFSYENCYAYIFTSLIFSNKSCFLHEVYLPRPSAEDIEVWNKTVEIAMEKADVMVENLEQWLDTRCNEGETLTR